MIYVLNGGAPEKVSYFGNKNGYVICDNSGDDSNRDNLLKIFSTFNVNDYILITSEFQLELLATDYFSYYERYRDQIIHLKSSDMIKPNDLCSKARFTDLPVLGRTTTVVSKDDLAKFDKSKFVVKRLVGTGANGLVSGPKGGIKYSNAQDDYYVVQNLFTYEDCVSYTVPVAIKNGKVQFMVPMRGTKVDYFTLKWREFYIDGIANEIIEPFIQEIVDTFKIVDGFMEPEIAVDRHDLSSGHLVDLNPRFSYDCSTVNNCVEADIMDSYFNDTYFRVPDDYLSPIYTLSEVYCTGNWL